MSSFTAGPGRAARAASPPLVALLVAAIAFVARGPEARAQVMIKMEARRADAAQPPDDVVEEEAVNDAVVAPRQAFLLSNEQFDMWVFGNSGAPGSGRNKIDTLLELSVDDVARLCRLSNLQRQKLILAGRGDIKRFFEKVEEKRKIFDKLKADQNKIGELYQEVVPLQAMLAAGLFGDGSLYAKTLKRVLEESDESRYQEVLRDKQRFAYRAKVELAVAQVDQSLGLSDRQRRELVELILQESKPPARFGQYAYYLVLYQASRIPREKLRPLFEEKQWAHFVRTLESTRGMEQFLRQQGFILAKDDRPVIAHEFVNALRGPAARAMDLPDDVFAREADEPATAAAAGHTAKKD
ncbi:MAG: hypothetical protein U0790_12625 [Isosphaeraceae bacterium]